MPAFDSTVKVQHVCRRLAAGWLPALLPDAGALSLPFPQALAASSPIPRRPGTLRPPGRRLHLAGHNMESFDEGSGAGSSSTAEWFCNGSRLTHAHRRFIPSVSVALAGTTSWRCAWLQLLAYPIETPFCCMLSHVGMLPWCQSLQRAPLPGAARAGRQILCERQPGPLSGEASCTVFLAAPLEQSHMNDTHCKSSRCQPGPLPGGRRSRECCARCALRCDLVSTGPRFHILCYRESHPSLLTQEVNLADTANVAASPGLLKFARDNKLWDPSQGPLNFFRAFHTDTPADHRCAQPRFRGSFADA